MNLAILPLIQVAALPRLMMRTPERLTLTLPRSMPLRPSRPLHLQIEGENRSCSVAAEQVCEKWTLTFGVSDLATLVSLFGVNTVPDTRKNFPVISRRKFGYKS